jgi:AraC-like DNA-binding protein
MFTAAYDTGGGADDLEETYARYLPTVRITVLNSPHDFRWSGRLATRNGRALWRVRCNAEWSFATTATVDRSVFLTLPECGAFKVTDKHRELIARPGQAIIMHRPGDHDNLSLCAGEHARTSLKWSLAEVERALSSVSEEVRLDDLSMLPVFDLIDERGAVIRSLLNAIALDLANPQPPSALASSLMNEAVLRLLFEPALERLRPARTRPTILPRTVKQAIDFMQANVGAPIRIRDIADACCVTPRTLENGFRTFKDTTPIAYLRELRLEAVRRELLAGGLSVRVSEIARRWGFSDLGRFAEHYRRKFGVLPSETMRNR